MDDVPNRVAVLDEARISRRVASVNASEQDTAMSLDGAVTAALIALAGLTLIPALAGNHGGANLGRKTRACFGVVAFVALGIAGWSLYESSLPFRVTDLALTAESQTGPCPKDVELTGTVKARGGPGEVRYRLERSNVKFDWKKWAVEGKTGDTVIAETLRFVRGNARQDESVTLHVRAPDEMQTSTPLNVTCDDERDAQPVDRRPPTAPAETTATMTPDPLTTATLTADLTGGEVRSGPGDPDGTAKLRLRLTPASGRVCFSLSFTNVNGSTKAYVFRGGRGSRGQRQLNLIVPYPSQKNPRRGCANDQAEDAIQAVVNDPSAFFVAVFNEEFPEGVVRGQLE